MQSIVANKTLSNLSARIARSSAHAVRIAMLDAALTNQGKNLERQVRAMRMAATA